MTKTTQTAVVGVTGYAGAELARLLLHHPRLKGRPPVFAGRVEAKDAARGGVPLAEIHPHLAGHDGSGKLKLEPFSWELLQERGAEVLFLATPHELSREVVPEALSRGLRVIDLSGAWRLTEAANRAIYAFADEGSELAAATQAQAVYGMPELNRKQISGAQADCESRLLRDFDHSGAEASGCRGTSRSRSRHCGRRQKRRERRGKSAHGKDALYVGGGQSFGVQRFRPSPHRRVAGADRRGGGRDCFYAASAADSPRHIVDDLCALQAGADAGERGRGLSRVFLWAARW